jgi:CTP:molybdopterin cytidylyltransferase MocA
MTGYHKPSAIILAAGFSRRMTRFKPLLSADGESVLERVVGIFRDAGIVDIRVVAGYRSAAVSAVLAALPVTVVDNPDPARGMFSSVLAGVHSLPADVRSFFIHPVDIPLVRPHTLRKVMAAFNAHPSTVVYPAFDDRRGHPPLIHAKLKATICAHDGGGGLRALLQRFDATARDIQVADEGVLVDLDTPADYRRFATRLATLNRLTDPECRVLMQRVRRLSDSIVDHCQKVASVAKAVVEAVSGSGGTIDGCLVQSAARVHDVGKPENNHAAVGARLLAEMGFPAMAEIVAAHMDIDVALNSRLDEAQVVYLADKLVNGSTIVDVIERFDDKLRKYGHDPQVSALIRRRQRSALTIRDKVERATGKRIDQLVRITANPSERQPCETP